MSIDVVCIGQTCLDVLIKGADLSVPFEREMKVVESVTTGVGGDATNQSIVLSRLGLRTRLICGLGDDDAGVFLKDIIARAGVDTSQIITVPEAATLISVVIIEPDGERNFIHIDTRRYATVEPDAAAMQARIVSFASMMLPPFTDVERVTRMARRAKENGSTLCADVTAFNDVFPFEDYRPAMPYIDFIFPNEDEGMNLTGSDNLDGVADHLLDMGVKNVVIKTGKKGCFIKNRRIRETVPAFDTPVLDTTGAGDNFASGFMLALLEDRPLIECCRYANATAGVAAGSIGANTGVRSRVQIEEFMAAHRQY